MQPSLYIHIPFCKQKCIYCDFYSAIYAERPAGEYVDVLVRQIGALQYAFPTIFIGGGTPTALAAPLLKKLLGALAPSIRAAAEVTIEANPESLTDDKVKLLLDHGVNRLSLGVQSFCDTKLRHLGRMHNAARAREAVIAAAKQGFGNISIDLIFGVWGETPDGWKRDLDAAMELPIQHISTYGLTYEQGTPLAGALAAKSVVPLEDEAVAALYEYTIEFLATRGLGQYEVSSFAREGFRCKHNLRYWDNDPHVGLGASASSYLDGVRGKNVADAAEYVRRFEDRADIVESREKLPPEKSARETAAIRIRTKDGIDFEWFRAKTGFSLRDLAAQAIPALIDKGLIEYIKEGDAATGIRLRRKGFLFCDTVSSALL